MGGALNLERKTTIMKWMYTLVIGLMTFFIGMFAASVTFLKDE
jgi:hypothetical protein